MAALGILGAGIWWCTHPTWFRDFGAEEGTVTTPGRAVWAGVTFPDVSEPPVTLHLDSVVAHAVSDTTGASVTPFVCTNRPQDGRGMTALGTGGTAMMRRYCIHLVRAREVDMTVGRGHPEYLILKILPAHRGRLRLDRVDIDYRNGLQVGTQTISFGLTVKAWNMTHG